MDAPTTATPVSSAVPASQEEVSLESLPALPQVEPAATTSASPFVPPTAAPMTATPPPVPPPNYYAAPARSGGSGCLWTTIILLMLALVGAVMIILVQLGASSLEEIAAPAAKPAAPRKLSESLVEAGKESSTDRIVRIDLDGPIFSESMGGSLFAEAMPMVESIKRQLAQAVKDSKVKAIVLRVNSPGGEVTASDTIYAAVKEANAKKPVVVFMDSVAASGGYYVSAPATRIIANQTTLTGSIGVIMQGYAYHGAMEKIGLGTNTFTSGKFKDTLSGSRPMRDDERAYIQGMVDQMYDRFLTIVSEGRKIDKAVLRDGIADGRVMGGKDALAAKLVDQLGYVEDAYKAARELGKCANAMVVRYKQQVSLFEALGVDAEARTQQKIELHVPGLQQMHSLKAGHLYYMMPGMVAHE